MKSSRQQTALQLWQGLPHALIWMSLLLMCMVFGYDGLFYNILPALPLMVALILAWESPPATLPFSVLGSGLMFDLLAGQPLGMNGLLWALIYWWHLKHLRSTDDDAPFIARWIKTSFRLLQYIVLEIIVSWWLALNTPTITEACMHLALMALLLPVISWSVIRMYRSVYRKLWMFLPPEVKPV